MITNESYVILIHRIADECQGNRLNENLKVSKAKLEKFIAYQKKRGYTFISVAEFIENLDMKRRQRKVLVFTADDGYKDVIENGMQLFEHFEIPLTLFLVPNFLNKQITPWWHMLEEYINENIDDTSLHELEFNKLRKVFLNENYLGIESLFKKHYCASKEISSNFRKKISNYFLTEQDICKLEK
jgi:peptidoglycan/xylan/chitin deacetylase (PgdA/CDA1 family)